MYIYICKSILHHPFFMFKSIYIYRVLIKYYIIYFVLHNPPRSVTTGRPPSRKRRRKRRGSIAHCLFLALRWCRHHLAPRWMIHVEIWIYKLNGLVLLGKSTGNHGFYHQIYQILRVSCKCSHHPIL